jgi:DNA-directed RNA polymerase II subunit RPB2
MSRNQPNLEGNAGRDLAKFLIYKYFQSQDHFLVRHHLDSYNQFLKTDLQKIIAASNPIILMKEEYKSTSENREKGEKSDILYEYKIEVFLGGVTGDKIYIGSPTLSLKRNKEIRLLFPNEARLRNLSYQAAVLADIFVRVTFGNGPFTTGIAQKVQERTFEKVELFQMPIMLHSEYCLLHNKPAEFLTEAGECRNDQGGYFIIDGAEKVLITAQEQAFNVLYLKNQLSDPKVQIFGKISCLSTKSRVSKSVTFYYLRQEQTILVGIPFVRKPVPLFILFRALGLSSDEEIVRTIFPDANSEEAKLMESLLAPSIADAFPFIDPYTAIQYIKTLTKGFSEEHVIDILRNQLFIHIDEDSKDEKGEQKAIWNRGGRIFFLAECVRKILRRILDLDPDTDRDDTRAQRCFTSGFLFQMFFQGVYKTYIKAVTQTIDKMFTKNPSLYRGEAVMNMFTLGNQNELFMEGELSDLVKRGFKGKWGGQYGESKDGALQSLSRLSYLDFTSHLRRVILNFDTKMKLTSPRKLHTSQYGYFCTNETPSGASIGITKNLSMFTLISTNTDPQSLINWLYMKGTVVPCLDIPMDSLPSRIPVYVNNGIIGFTENSGEQGPGPLVMVLKLMKWTGCLPSSASVGFDYQARRIFIYLDDGRPLRPLIHLGSKGLIPYKKLREGNSWLELVLGAKKYKETTLRKEIVERTLDQPGFYDPLFENEQAKLSDYIQVLAPLQGAIEYIDPYEQNTILVAGFPEQIQPETSHLEIHPSTIVSFVTAQIPFANHNQGVRNQLSDAQSKAGLSLYATNFKNRFDGTADILCYGEAPITRTLYYDFFGDGSMPYGQNIILAMGCLGGYNRDDGIVFNRNSLERGLFRSINQRSYNVMEEEDRFSKAVTRIAHPRTVGKWTELKPGLDYKKLDENGIIKVGEYVDERTVIVARYISSETGAINDASVTPQVWTFGRVESVVVTVNNKGLRLVKIRVTQDRIPELGDKFSNRHGQKGTMGMMFRAQDLPRTASGITPDLMMNPHAIPSRMTIGQLLESMMGKLAASTGAIGNGTLFMSEENPNTSIGETLEQIGFERYGNEIMYDGQTGRQLEAEIFIGNVFTMRLKQMVLDKWNARTKGRKEMRTHQPTGGRGNQGGLRIGEMERDAILCHGISDFMTESMMLRADGTKMLICNSCGLVPIENTEIGFITCPMCEGPVKYIGSSATDLELLPPSQRGTTTFSTVEIPYTLELLNKELQTYANIGMRYITGKYAYTLQGSDDIVINRDDARRKAMEPLPVRQQIEDVVIPERIKQKESPEVNMEDLSRLGAVLEEQREEQKKKAQEPTLTTVPVRAEIGLTPVVTQQPVVQLQPTTRLIVDPSAGLIGEGAPLEEGEYEEFPGAEGQGQGQQGQQVVQLQQQPLVQLQQPMTQAMVQLQPTTAIPTLTMSTGQIPTYTMGGIPVMQQGQVMQQGPGILEPGPLGIQPTGAQIFKGGFANAPMTIAVDTGERMMNSLGLQGATQPSARRNPASRSGSPGGNQRGQNTQAPAQNSNVKVNIVKSG